MKKILIIIPAYNEEASIEKALASVIKSGFDYIVINDGSTDSTSEILDKNNYNHIDLFYNLGIGGAVQTGYKYALEKGYDTAVQFDADGQHNIEFVDSITEPIQNGDADMVIGSRFVKKNASEFKSTAMRQIGIKTLSGFIKFLTGKRVFDVTSGFRAINKDLITRFAKDYPREYPEPISNYELLRCGYKIKELPVKMNKRIGGKSSIHSWKSVYFVINVFLSILLTPTKKEKKC